jgi:hypothetical protein
MVREPGDKGLPACAKLAELLPREKRRTTPVRILEKVFGPCGVNIKKFLVAVQTKDPNQAGAMAAASLSKNGTLVRCGDGGHCRQLAYS